MMTRAETVDCRGGRCEGTPKEDMTIGTAGPVEIFGKVGSDSVEAQGTATRSAGAGTRRAVRWWSRVRRLHENGRIDLLFGGHGGDSINTIERSVVTDENVAESGLGDELVFAVDSFPYILDCGEDAEEDTIFFDVLLDTVRDCEILNP